MSRASLKVLMCAPRHYAIHYEINPWMKLENPIERTNAQRQWDGLHHTLSRLGVDILTVPQRKGCPDMVFTANAGVVTGRTFIPSHFRYPERQPETAAFTRFFKSRGYQISDIAKNYFFEGEGDLLPYQDVLFGGFRFRSELRAHEKVTDFLGKRLIGLELARDRFYHLDTCFFPVDDKTVVYYPDAFDAYGRKAIRRFVEHPIAVGKDDAHHFACNAVRVGRTVVVNHASRSLKRRLLARGYQVEETPTSEFVKAGGSVKCLLLIL